MKRVKEGTTLAKPHKQKKNTTCSYKSYKSCSNSTGTQWKEL